MTDRLLNIHEVAEILRVSAETVRRFLRTGKLTGVKFGRGWRVRESELAKFVGNGKDKSQEEKHDA